MTSDRPAAHRTHQDPVPWDEIAVVVGDRAVVAGLTQDLRPGMPSGWCEPSDAAEGLPVVLVAPRHEDQVHEAHRLAADRPVVVILPNLGRPVLLGALLVGHGDEIMAGERRAALTRGTVDRVMADCGRGPASVLSTDARPLNPTGRPLDDLLSAVAIQAGGSDRPWLVRTYDQNIQSPAPGQRPFLSVLVRTQGVRLPALSDVLLCLTAQTCADFEVLLLAHDVSDAPASALRAIHAALPYGIRERTSVVPVTGGGRARPLTVGTRLARGRYVAVLDDDDLVLARWVESFRQAATEQPGSIVRSVTLEQHVEAVEGAPGFRATSWPAQRWEAEFSLLSHLVDNHSPVHAYALPREVFHTYGLGFDERLPVLEDWDLLVRAAALMGVRDTGEVTAIYRRWPSTHSSFAEVSEDRWPETAWRVVSNWDAMPLLLPQGSASRLREEGIYVLRHQPLRRRVRRRVEGWRDRWSAPLMRTPIGRPLRWAYRRLRHRTEPPT